MRRSAPFAVLSLLLVIPTVAWCQPQGPKAGPEFQVNTYTTSSQYSDAIGVSADGSFTILWDSLGQDGSDWGIFGRRFDSLGIPLDASDFQVNTYTTGLQIYGSLAVAPSGDFIVAWSGYGPGGHRALFARRFDSSGMPLDPEEFQINADTSHQVDYPSVAVSETGSFIVVWQVFVAGGPGVAGRRFDSVGDPLDPVEFQIASPSGGDYAQDPTVGASTSGDFVVAWKAYDYSYNGAHVLARRYDSSGNALDAAPIQVDTPAAPYPERHAVAVAPSGQFVVSWSSNETASNGDYYEAAFARRYDSSGAPLDAAPIRVSPGAANSIWGPFVSINAAGDFVTTWGSDYSTENGDFQILGRRFTSEGVAVDPEPFQVNTYTTGYQLGGQVALADSGNFTVVWGSDGQDGDGYGVFAQRFSCSDLDGDGICDGEDIVVNEPADGSALDCPARGTAGPLPVVAWSPGNYDRFRVTISGDPDFTPGSLVRSSAVLQTATSWTPRQGQWRHACRRLGPDLYIRVYGEDTDLSSSDPRYSTFSNVVHVTTTTVMKLPLREGLGGK